MVAGALAGCLASFLTNPMDVIKTRLQTDPALYNGVLDCARQTLQGEGGRAFLKGSMSRHLHKIPANGLFFLFYETFRGVLKVEKK